MFPPYKKKMVSRLHGNDGKADETSGLLIFRARTGLDLAAPRIGSLAWLDESGSLKPARLNGDAPHTGVVVY